MKVICIADSKKWFDEETGLEAVGPGYMEECFVIGLDKSGYYKIEGYDCSEENGGGYAPNWFIPTSNKNELSVPQTIFEKNSYDLKQLIQ